MRIFITGATGFIGSHVAYRLLEANHELVVLARNPSKTPSLSAHPRVRRVTADLYDRAVIRRELDGCEACVHVALGWGVTPIEMLQADTTATVSLLTSCVEARVERFLYTSSTAALGRFLPHMSERDPSCPSDYYGATKAASEAYVMAVAATTGMRCNVIRPGYTFDNPVAEGAPTQPDQRFATIVRLAMRGEEIRLRAGDGTQFISGRDLSRLYAELLVSERTREVYYGLGSRFVTWESIARMALEVTGSRSPIVLTGEAEPPKLFDVGKMAEHFGLRFEPEPHLREHVEYLASHLDEGVGG